MLMLLVAAQCIDVNIVCQLDFLTKETLYNYILKCKNNKLLEEEVLPEEETNTLEFKNKYDMCMHPFNITADFESRS